LIPSLALLAAEREEVARVPAAVSTWGGPAAETMSETTLAASKRSGLERYSMRLLSQGSKAALALVLVT
jgi:hypothetical protein